MPPLLNSESIKALTTKHRRCVVRPKMFPLRSATWSDYTSRAQTGKHLLRKQNVSKKKSENKNVSATNVSFVRRRENVERNMFLNFTRLREPWYSETTAANFSYCVLCCKFLENVINIFIPNVPFMEISCSELSHQALCSYAIYPPTVHRLWVRTLWRH